MNQILTDENHILEIKELGKVYLLQNIKKRDKLILVHKELLSEDMVTLKDVIVMIDEKNKVIASSGLCKKLLDEREK